MKIAKGNTRVLLSQILLLRDKLDQLSNELRNDRDRERLTKCQAIIQDAQDLCNEKLNEYKPLNNITHT